HRQLRGFLCATDLQCDYRDALPVRFLERGTKALRAPCRLDEQSDDTGLGKVEHEIQVQVHRHADLVAGRDGEIEADALFAVHDPAHARAGVADQAHVTGRFVHTAVEPAGPHTVPDVVEAHSVGPAGEHACTFQLCLHAGLQRRLG